MGENVRRLKGARDLLKVTHYSALVLLEQRLARGEIDSEEFKKRRQDLLTR